MLPGAVLGAVLSVALPASAGAQQVPTPPAGGGPLPHWTLAWSDEFNQAAGTLPDASKWSYDAGSPSYGNQEMENYCVPGSGTAPCVQARPNAFQDGKGHLVIEARRGADGKWTSARMKTQARYQFNYGRVEARMRLPVGDGLWPAFWMLGADMDTVNWPKCGEADILEWVQSYGPTTTSSTSHGPGYSGAQGITGRYTFPDGGRVDDGFHVYGVLWSKDKLEYYRDDPSHVFLTLTPASLPGGTAWAYNHPFFLILNLAIGSGGFAGPTDATTPQTARMLVDWVRVYRPGSELSTRSEGSLLPAAAAGVAQYRLATEEGYCGSARQKTLCDRSVHSTEESTMDAELMGMQAPE